MIPRRTLVGLLALCAVLTGCSTRDRDLSWVVSFADPMIASQARGIEARVLAGGCTSSDVLFEASFEALAPGPMPSSLPPGPYAFAALARNFRCEVTAEGCTPVTLPLVDGSQVETVLLATPSTDVCDTDRVCVNGRCVTSDDGGVADGGCASDASCMRIVPSNVPPPAVPGMDVTLTSSQTYHTSDCPTGVLGDASVAMLSDDSPVCVVSVGDLTVGGGVTLTVQGALPLVILAEGTVMVDGVIDAGARRDVPGPGGGRAGRINGGTDEPAGGPYPGGRGQDTGGYEDGGGGGGGLCGPGGDGGQGGAMVSGGPGGRMFATPTELTPLVGGSGGGGVRGGETIGPTGGAGGGAIQNHRAREHRHSGQHPRGRRRR